ncbi:MAG: ABC transporter ATP-binding protein [Clostridia bacterium]|nr:ABC transporter ATP-binding protein [Clostridia bacterium]
MKVLKVDNLSKSYPYFELKNVSFSVEKGSIMGFIGRNGAGKTTTLKAIMNMVRASSGSVEFFGLDMTQNESDIKKRIGYAGGAVDYYKRKKIKKLLDITSIFYDNWDSEVCKKYMSLFSINENKTPSELSEGMKVKLNLVIALSHGAELLVLDEPTSGLDPVSRAELLEIFKRLKERGISILFSTHITSDLDQCADEITYIREGEIVYTGDLSDFTKGETLEQIMIREEKEAVNEKFAF